MPGNTFIFVAATAALVAAGAAHSEKPATGKFKGVVTYHLIPAKVMRVNEIIENPEPGTSYIGGEGILFELERDVDVRANWTVVEVEYYRYEEPKEIRYELFGETHELAVEYHAVNVDMDGDISEYIGE